MRNDFSALKKVITALSPLLRTAFHTRHRITYSVEYKWNSWINSHQSEIICEQFTTTQYKIRLKQHVSIKSTQSISVFQYFLNNRTYFTSHLHNFYSFLSLCMCCINPAVYSHLSSIPTPSFKLWKTLLGRFGTINKYLIKTLNETATATATCAYTVQTLNNIFGVFASSCIIYTQLHRASSTHRPPSRRWKNSSVGIFPF